MNSERVTVDADDLLALLNLIGENIDDLADEEQELLDRCKFHLDRQAPVTLAEYERRIQEHHEFIMTTITGGLMDLGAPARHDGQESDRP